MKPSIQIVKNLNRGKNKTCISSLIIPEKTFIPHLFVAFLRAKPHLKCFCLPEESYFAPKIDAILF
jgi:hypothetical protein